MSRPFDLFSAPDASDAAPPALLPYQQRWVADASPLKIAEKSRRIGLTWGEAADDVIIAAAEKRAGGSNVFYTGPSQDMALEYVEACAMWARAYDMAASAIDEGIFEDIDDSGETRHIKTYRIHFPRSGHRIVALSSRPTNLRGKQGVIVIDEAAFHPDLKGMLKAAMAMLLWGDRVRVLSTHDGVDNAFNELVQEVRAGRRKGSVHRITFREAVEQGLYRRVCLRKGIAWRAENEAAWVADAYAFYGEDAAEELDVVPSSSAGAYLSMDLIERRMSADTPIVRGRWQSEFTALPDAMRAAEIAAWCEEEIAPHLVRVAPTLWYGFGEDFARLADLTVIAVFEEGADLIVRCVLWIELSNCPFSQQEQILFFVVDALRGRARFRSGVMDARGNGQYLAERAAQRYGAARIEQVMATDAWYLEAMPRFKAALEDGTLDALPRDAQVRDDLRSLRLINGVPKLPASPTQRAGEGRLQRHGDGAIASCMGYRAMKREVAPIEWTAGPDKAGRWEGVAREGFSMQAVARRAAGGGKEGGW
jgi:phage FluMu gp28-like protein